MLDIDTRTRAWNFFEIADGHEIFKLICIRLLSTLVFRSSLPEKHLKLFPLFQMKYLPFMCSPLLFEFTLRHLQVQIPC